MEKMKDKFILDACCGGRMFWFDKRHPNVLYIDKRIIGDNNPEHRVKPDIVMDFKNMDFKDNEFKLVVFDPPHIRRSNDNKGHIARDYGVLSPNWKSDIKAGFDECWRVLDDYGVLIFKWSSVEIPIKDVLGIIGKMPLFGHKTRQHKNMVSSTHWFCFMKIPQEENPNE